MKNKAMKKLSIALAAVIALTLLLPMTAYAVNIGTKDNMVDGGIVLGTDNDTPTQIGFGGKEWVVIGYNGFGVASTADTMTLLLASWQGSGGNDFVNFHGSSNRYSDSTLKVEIENRINNYILDSRERGMISPRNLEGNTPNYNSPEHNPDKIAGSDVSDALLWPLSVYEASQINSDTARVFSDAPWWLRSPGPFDNMAAFVDYLGIVYVDGIDDGAEPVFVDDTFAIRPAFKLNLNSVLFTSAANSVSGKSTVAVGGGLVVASATTGPIKLTVEDAGLSLTLSNVVMPGVAGSTASFDYAASAQGSSTYDTLSAIVTDSNGAVKYYGKLISPSNQSGSASVTLPSDFVTGDKLLVFIEQCNGDYETDFASAPVQVSTPAPVYTGGSSAPTFTRRTLTDTPTGVKVTAGMTSGTRLNVATNTLHTARTCPACDEIRARQAAGDVLALFDISLTGSHKGDYEVFIPFSGSGYYTVLHCNNGKLEKQSGLYANGGITSTWAKLSPFAVISGADVAVPDNTVTDPPKTGSVGSIGGIVMALIGLIGMAVLRVARRRQTKRRA